MFGIVLEGKKSVLYPRKYGYGSGCGPGHHTLKFHVNFFYVMLRCCQVSYPVCGEVLFFPAMCHIIALPRQTADSDQTAPFGSV